MRETMKNAMEEKRKVVEEYRNSVGKKYSEILEKNQKNISDDKKKGSFGIEVFEKLKVGFGKSEERLLNMTGAERIQLAEIWSRDSKNLLDFYKDDPGYQSTLKDYDDLIAYWRQQLEAVNEKIQKIDQSDATEKDKEQRRLLEEKERAYAMAK